MMNHTGRYETERAQVVWNPLKSFNAQVRCPGCPGCLQTIDFIGAQVLPRCAPVFPPYPPYGWRPLKSGAHP